MKLQEVTSGLYHILFENQYSCCSTFLRLQEYYESPIKGIRGNYFTLEQFMDAYAETKGNFTYTLDWGGFNVPGHVIKKFFDLFGMNLLEKEKNLYHLL